MKFLRNFDKKTNSISLGGFTVIELIISMSLFVIISGLIVGSFVTAIRTQRTIISLIEAKDNMGLALEQMTRETRLSTNFDGTTKQELNFMSINGSAIRYFYKEENGIGEIERCENFNCFPITSPALNVSNFYVTYNRSFGGGITPPRITISFSVSPSDENLTNYFSFNVQTTVSARQL